MAYQIPIMGQGNAKPATSEDKTRDDVGFTNPNLHERIEMNSQPEGEFKPRKYHVSIQGVNQYRTTESFLHDDEVNEDEIP